MSGSILGCRLRTYPKKAALGGCMYRDIIAMHACKAVNNKYISTYSKGVVELPERIWRNGPYIGGHHAYIFKLNFKHISNLL